MIFSKRRLKIQPFPSISELLSVVDRCLHLRAICSICSVSELNASFSIIRPEMLNQIWTPMSKRRPAIPPLPEFTHNIQNRITLIPTKIETLYIPVCRTCLYKYNQIYGSKLLLPQVLVIVCEHRNLLNKFFIFLDITYN